MHMKTRALSCAILNSDGYEPLLGDLPVEPLGPLLVLESQQDLGDILGSISTETTGAYVSLAPSLTTRQLEQRDEGLHDNILIFG